MLFIMADNLTNGNIHTMVSTTPTLIYLAAGAAKVELLQPVLAVQSRHYKLLSFRIVTMFCNFFGDSMSSTCSASYIE